MEWTRCPQCGLVAEVVDRDVWPSTDGPVEHVHVRCVDRHRFVLPVAIAGTARCRSRGVRHRAPSGVAVGAARTPIINIMSVT